MFDRLLIMVLGRLLPHLAGVLIERVEQVRDVVWLWPALVLIRRCALVVVRSRLGCIAVMSAGWLTLRWLDSG
jgi:hypothetical protein